ncbi:MAG: hypothetical protein WCG47_25865 [Dermatophilaceae bacterium]
MKRAEAESLAHLTGQAARGVTRIAQDTQNAVTDRVYERLTPRIGPVAGPIHTIHRALTQHAYFWVHAGVEAAALAARVITAARASGIGSISDRPRGRATLAFVNGIRGDHLHREGSPLALQMTLRHAGRDVAAEAGSLRTAYGRGHTRLAVFVHGLVETEDSWQYRSSARWGSDGVSYGSRLHADLGYLPIWLRYNTGRTLAANGAALAALLTRLVRAWPATVEELVLVGHSMGGLVILTALAQSDEAASLPVRAAITLGAPRHGSPLERHAHAIAQRTQSVPPARWAHGILRLRSEGIKDLHSGAGPTSLTLPPTVGQYAVLSTITPQATSLVGARIGDGLVPVPARHTVDTAVLGGLHHLDLLNHPRVYERLTTWLAPAPAAGTAVAAR